MDEIFSAAGKMAKKDDFRMLPAAKYSVSMHYTLLLFGSSNRYS
ncbi:hypothetical protein [Chlorobium sp.]|nr:hypothetical protein [Chlorobium sp.]